MKCERCGYMGAKGVLIKDGDSFRNGALHDDCIIFLTDEIARLQLESGIWKKFATEHQGECMNGIDNGDPCICGLLAAENGDFKKAAKQIKKWDEDDE